MHAELLKICCYCNWGYCKLQILELPTGKRRFFKISNCEKRFFRCLMFRNNSKIVTVRGTIDYRQMSQRRFRPAGTKQKNIFNIYRKTFNFRKFEKYSPSEKHFSNFEKETFETGQFGSFFTVRFRIKRFEFRSGNAQRRWGTAEFRKQFFSSSKNDIYQILT